MPSRRTQRVADLVQHEVAAILLKDIKDPRVGIVTITGVDVSPDLRNAKVYYTVLGGDKEREDTAKGLTSALPFLRREIAHRLSLKSAPELRFFYDDTLDRAERMDRLLDEVGSEPRSEDG